MDIKLLALDLDHTLLNEERQINDCDLRAIQAARSAGVVITIATGRMYSAAHRFARDLEIDVPIITLQGSLIKTLLSEEEVLHLRLSNKVARQAIAMALEAEIHVNVYDGDILYVRENNALVERYTKVNRINVEISPEKINHLKIHPTKVVFVENDLAKLDRLEVLLADKFGKDWDVIRSLPHLLEIGHPNATKSQALAFLTKQLGIKQSAVMAIGDGLNDLDMLNWAGVGVAMGNASPEVKEQADWVTDDNKSGGVAKAIAKYIIDSE